MSLLDDILAANAAVTSRTDVPVPAVPDRCRVVVVTCGEIAAPAGRALAPFLGLAPDEVFVIANAGARIHAPDGDVVRSVAAALADAGGGEVFVIAHEDCAFLEADPESLAALLAGGFSSAIASVGAFCGESFVSARKLALTSAQMLRTSAFLPRATPVHALLLSTARGALSCEEAGYGRTVAVAAAGSPASSFLAAPPPILGAHAPGDAWPAFGTAGPVTLFGTGPSPLMGAAPPLMAPPPDLGAGAAAFVAPPPPPGFVMPAAALIPPMPSMPYVPPQPYVPPPAPLSFTEHVPPPPPRTPHADAAKPQTGTPPKPKPPADADDPFRRANEVLERLRRERRK